MKKFPLAIGALTIIILIGGIYLFSRNSSEGAYKKPETPEYFWSETCPHCKNVADFIETWEGKDKFQMNKIEVNSSNENSIRFYQVGSFCKIPRNNLGVPLLVNTDGKCLQGDEPIIQFLQELDL